MARDLPSVDDLRAFLAVVQHGSLRAAAATTGETRGTVSRRLTRLERLLGVGLLKRSTHNVVVTTTGFAYARRVRAVLASLAEADSSARADFAKPGGRLRVSAPPGYGHYVIAPVMARFIKKHPQISVDFDVSMQVLDFEAMSIDVAIRGSQTGRLPDTSLVAHRLCASPFVCVASPAYLCDMPPVRSTRDLRSHRGIICRFGEAFAKGRAGKHWGPAVGSEVPTTIVCNCVLIQKDLILAGAGLGFVPRVFVDQDLAHGRLAELLPRDRGGNASAFLLHRAADPLPPNVRLFRDFVLREVGHRREGSVKDNVRAR